MRVTTTGAFQRAVVTSVVGTTAFVASRVTLPACLKRRTRRLLAGSSRMLPAPWANTVQVRVALLISSRRAHLGDWDGGICGRLNMLVAVEDKVSLQRIQHGCR